MESGINRTKRSTDEFPTILLVGYDGGWTTLVEGLRSDGYHVLLAGDYNEALQIAGIHSRQIHLILVHAGMSASTLAASLKPFRLGIPVLHDIGLPIETRARIQELIKPPKT
jgi:hypothetical protein